jgi:hypothetical protein
MLKPGWSSASFLVYLGGLTVLGAAVAALSYLSGHFGDAAYAAWSLLVLVALGGIAYLSRARDRLVAGVFAFAAVAAFAGFVAALWTWWGWLPGGSGTGSARSPFSGFHVGLLALELLTLVAAVAALRTFRFPLLAWTIAVTAWLFVTDLISNGGNWSAWVTLVYGVALLGAARVLDRRPDAFWLHVVSGLTIGGALLYFWHSGNWHWSFIAVGGVLYIWIAATTGRSSWAVLGALGLFMAATHFAIEWWHQGLPFLFVSSDSSPPRSWVPPVVFAVLGFVLVAFGLAVKRHERE